MGKFARIAIGAVVCAAVPAGAQIVRAPPTAVVSVPMVPTPLTVRVEVPHATLPTSTGGLAASTAIPQSVSTVAAAPAAAANEVAVADESGQYQPASVSVEVAPPPPGNAEELPEGDCKVDDDNDMTTPPRDCGEVVAEDATDWATNDSAANEVTAAPDLNASGESREASTSGWLIGAGVAFAALLGLLLLRRR